MAFLRNKKRSIDLSSNNTDHNLGKCQMDEGQYRCAKEHCTKNDEDNKTNEVDDNNNIGVDDQQCTDVKCENSILDSTFMNGVISTSPCVTTNKLLEKKDSSLELLDERSKKEECHPLGSESEQYTLPGEIAITEQEQLSHEQKLSEITIDDDSDSSRSCSPALEHNIDNELTLSFHSYIADKRKKIKNLDEISSSDDEGGKDEERDSFSEHDLHFQTRKNFNRTRHSLDSQMPLLPQKYKSNLKGTSLDSLHEDEIDKSITRPLKKKSISWASDLETVHEFEKIKGRRLSLSSLFRKF